MQIPVSTLCSDSLPSTPSQIKVAELPPVQLSCSNKHLFIQFGMETALEPCPYSTQRHFVLAARFQLLVKASFLLGSKKKKKRNAFYYIRESKGTEMMLFNPRQKPSPWLELQICNSALRILGFCLEISGTPFCLLFVCRWSLLWREAVGPLLGDRDLNFQQPNQWLRFCSSCLIIVCLIKYSYYHIFSILEDDQNVILIFSPY